MKHLRRYSRYVIVSGDKLELIIMDRRFKEQPRETVGRSSGATLTVRRNDLIINFSLARFLRDSGETLRERLPFIFYRCNMAAGRDASLNKLISADLNWDADGGRWSNWSKVI